MIGGYRAWVRPLLRISFAVPWKGSGEVEFDLNPIETHTCVLIYKMELRVVC
jgi:hypothetical protein